MEKSAIHVPQEWKPLLKWTKAPSYDANNDTSVTGEGDTIESPELHTPPTQTYGGLKYCLHGGRLGDILAVAGLLAADLCNAATPRTFSTTNTQSRHISRHCPVASCRVQSLTRWGLALGCGYYNLEGTRTRDSAFFLSEIDGWREAGSEGTPQASNPPTDVSQPHKTQILPRKLYQYVSPSDQSINLRAPVAPPPGLLDGMNGWTDEKSQAGWLAGWLALQPHPTAPCRTVGGQTSTGGKKRDAPG